MQVASRCVPSESQSIARPGSFPAGLFPVAPLQWRVRGLAVQWRVRGLAVLVASGPSLTREDVEYCRKKARVLTVNDAWRYAPWADALYACDAAWWNYHGGAPEFRGQKWTSLPIVGGKIEAARIAFGEEAIKRWGLSWVRGDHRLGLSLNRQVIHFGDNSGYQALNLAVLFGARRILLLGYDMQQSKGRNHFFGEHPQPLARASDYKTWVDIFKTTVPDLARSGVEVINCSRETALDCFPRANLRDVL